MIYFGNSVVQQHSGMATSLTGPEPTWPDYTCVVRSPPDNSINLTEQGIELQLVIRKAMNLTEGRVRFRDVFPPLPKRSKWNHECLKKACNGFENSSVGNAKKKYIIIQKRLDNDHRYFMEVSSLVCIFQFMLRSN